MKDLIIIGAGGLGRETAMTVERINASLEEREWKIIGFMDDNLQIQGQRRDGYKIIGTTEEIKQYPDAYFIVAIGDSKIRRRIVKKIKIFADVKFATIIDPAAVIDKRRVNIGEGSIICANTYITLDIEMGEHIYIGANSTIGHDARLGDYATLYPGVNLAGITEIGAATELGTGSQVIQKISVGSNTVIGAGSTVVRNIPSNCTAVGSPARVIKMNDKRL
ncbi:MAG: acetyltransferase [Ruminococcus sp.]|nr:acetyltransferase [Candidatus Copronaster equi]